MSRHCISVYVGGTGEKLLSEGAFASESKRKTFVEGCRRERSLDPLGSLARARVVSRLSLQRLGVSQTAAFRSGRSLAVNARRLSAAADGGMRGAGREAASSLSASDLR